MNFMDIFNSIITLFAILALTIAVLLSIHVKSSGSKKKG
jgi:hypothetical protein